ncbi:MAG: hypothetical protein H7Y37_13960 [Anaerolineae bacterium]|nr:hypothetical protein [Gloeobacterales cyanobacterium ES-bin-313]
MACECNRRTLVPPARLHSGEAHQRRERRQQVLAAAYAHPDRFVRKAPEPPAHGGMDQQAETK